MFQVNRTFNDPGASQSGFATPGAGDQYNEGAQTWGSIFQPPIEETPERPTKGIFSWLFQTPASEQRGGPEPFNSLQHRPPGAMPNDPPPFGEVYQHWTPYYSRGAAAYVPNTGKVLTNPIGAGVVALHRPQASYGPSAQYIDHALWWTSQTIPTSVSLQGLTNPEQLAALLDSVEIQAVVRVG